MDKTIKQRLIIYSVISGFSFVFLLTVPYVGIGMPIYAILQTAMVLYLIKGRNEVINKKAILVFVPILILTLSYFIRDNYLFKQTNFLVIFVLYSTMILIMKDNLGVKKESLYFIKNIFCTIFLPLTNFNVPFIWLKQRDKSSANTKLIKRILLGITLTIPCIIFLIIMLASADLVFYNKTSGLINVLGKPFDVFTIFKIVLGVLVAFYLFGLFFIVFDKKERIKTTENLSEATQVNGEPIKKQNPQGDLIILNILLASILVIYTMFVIIQFKYLFAGAKLPYGLTFAQYARKGFFELLFLSFLNIELILLTIYLTKDKLYNSSNKWGLLTKVLMQYLCAITVILLISSFYRMILYNNEYGFTHLRLLVLIFLIFEALGLMITFYFIHKPNFNIIGLYSVICLVFYLTINVINLDYIIAKKNIDMRYEGKELDIEYLYTLSADAAPQMKRLLDEKDNDIKSIAIDYFEKIDSINKNCNDWQSFNLSRYLAGKISFK